MILAAFLSGYLAMPAQLIQYLDVYANLLLLVFIAFYVWKVHKKEKELEKRETKLDTNYHHIVDNALAKERKILDDATQEATQIITSAQYVSQASKQTLDNALSKMVTDVEKETVATAQNFANNYSASLQKIASTSLSEFEVVMKELQTDLQKQIASFHQTVLPNLEKELDEYKQARIKQTESAITRIVQKASQEILNKTIPLEDHQNLVIESLEKAKKEGMFD